MAADRRPIQAKRAHSQTLYDGVDRAAALGKKEGTVSLTSTLLDVAVEGLSCLLRHLLLKVDHPHHVTSLGVLWFMFEHSPAGGQRLVEVAPLEKYQRISELVAIELTPV